MRVLIADDHAIFRAGVRSLLEAQIDIEVVAEAEDGLRAVEAAEAVNPDLVVLDISMPGLNGLEAARRILAERPEVKVLFLSVHSDTHYVGTAFRTGARGYLLKECVGDDLCAAIQALDAGQIYVSPGLAQAVVDGFHGDEREDPVLAVLTTREREVLQLFAEGHSTREIAERLSLSIKTIGSHREHLKQKIGTRSMAGLTKFAIRHGLASLED